MSSAGSSSPANTTTSTLWRAPDRLAVPLVAALVLLVWLTAGGPPSPAPAGAPGDAFSAARAEAVLTRLVGDGAPHPAGSVANAAVRERVLTELEAVGVRPTLQSGYACGGTCAWLTNIVAPVSGPTEGPVVLLTCHYDSVGAGPGVADDLSGVAALVEVVRALRVAPTRNRVVLLVTDGEEDGLLGAKLFGANPLSREVALVVNLDARGTGGRSYLFETGSANAWVVDRYAEHAPDPSAHSLYEAIYRLLPNGTDFAVHRALGAEGGNLAFIDPVVRYHTARDDLEHLDRGTLQHQGDNALALARGFGDADLGTIRPGDAVYFDLFGLALLRWPVGANATLVVLVAFGWMVVFAVALRRRRARLAEAAVGFSWILAGVTASVALGMLVAAAAAALAGHPAPWWAATTAYGALSAAVALAGMLLVAAVAGFRAGTWGTFLGAGVVWIVLAAVAAVWLPGATPIALFPALGYTLGGIVSLAWRGGDDPPPLALPIAFVWTAWLPLAEAFPVALPHANAAWIVPLAVLAVPLAPLMARRGTRHARALALYAAGALVVLGLAWTVASPRATVDRPAHANVLVIQDEAETGAWAHLQLPTAFRGAADTLPAPFIDAFEQVAGPSGGPLDLPVDGSAPLPTLSALAPEVTVTATEGLQTLTISSWRDADGAILCTRGEVGLDDGTRSPGLLRGGDCVIHRVAPDGHWPLVVYLRPAPGEESVWVGDETVGLPVEARALDVARGDTVSPWQQGDRTVVGRRVPLATGPRPGAPAP